MSAASDLSEKQTEQYARLYRGNGLPTEHVILDLHNGRLFGHWGPIVMNIVAITLVFLTLSGI
ncbi:MAG: hypothetical protein GXP13_08495 [Gammaproteobacteria bacterium]|nr:hypothetical protein [Gammaproteobacteria bacterium]